MQLPPTSHRIRLMQAIEANQLSLNETFTDIDNFLMFRSFDTPSKSYNRDTALLLHDFHVKAAKTLGVNYSWLAHGIGDPFPATQTPEESSAVAQASEPNEPNEPSHA
jgi:hypothetical protein